jgi:multisubunit Na+/H+ antiporter MnhG subunit
MATIMHAAAAVFLAIAVAVQILCALGLRLAPDPFDRLHLQAPAALLGPPLIAIAVAFSGASATAVAKACVAAVFLACANPLICYYTARSLLARAPEAAGGAESAGGAA